MAGIGLALMAGSVTGCGEDQAQVYPVRGKISFEGKPMAGGGSIAFMPLSSQEGRTAGGIVKEDGSYEMTTYAEGDGSIPGEFRVVITQTADKEPEPTPDGQQPAAAPPTSLAPAERIPPLYADPFNSPLKAKVEEKENEINFELTRQEATHVGA
jgi:hypothetical protein